MRLNEGLPVWHASVSLQQRKGSRWVDDPAAAERYALDALEGVGGTREWWYWNPAAHVGHLRVNVTADEAAALLPNGCAVHDAGESGPERVRKVEW